MADAGPPPPREGDEGKGGERNRLVADAGPGKRTSGIRTAAKPHL